MEKMKKDKTYNCKDCGKEVREKAVAGFPKDFKLCPQCYTKRYKK